MRIALVWFRQDLRLRDNPAFISACNHHDIVIPLYIYDKATTLLGRAQQWWLHHSLEALNNDLHQQGLKLVIRQGDALQIMTELIDQLSINSIYWNRCYEPFAIARDKKIKSNLLQSIDVKSTNGGLLNEPWTIKNKNGEYFKVFTPYWKHCLQTIVLPTLENITHHPRGLDIRSERLSDLDLLPKNPDWSSGFKNYWQPGEEGAQKNLSQFIEEHLTGYKTHRDIPASNATSRLSPHLHFGEISPWSVWHAIETAKWDPACDLPSADRFLSEIGWREFSYYLLYHFPRLPHDNFRKEFDHFSWDKNDNALTCWQKGKTGYPIIDAGMRELWATGYMHNRVRMIVASFLTKDLLIDWRIGADWFLDTLVDADLANNSASWQWVAGCGVDAAPYFRIFNPILQSEKFDPQGLYIRQWIPELAKIDNKNIHNPWAADSETRLKIGKNYPKPIIDHSNARKRALEYFSALKKLVPGKI